MRMESNMFVMAKINSYILTNMSMIYDRDKVFDQDMLDTI